MMASSAPNLDALHLLVEEHCAVRQLFGQASDPELADEALEPVGTQACEAWRRLAQLEAEFLHPKLKALGLAPGALHQALVEHQVAEELGRRLGGIPITDPFHRATLVVLGETIAHHLDKEEKQLFPLASALDLADITHRLRTRHVAPEKERRAEDGRLDIGTGEDRAPPLPK